MSLAEEKRLARREAARRRAVAHKAFQEIAGQALAARGLPVPPLDPAGTVSGFFPFGSEITVMPLIEKLTAEGWRTALPIVVGEGQPLIFRAWAPGDPTVPDVWQIPIPPPEAPELLPDVLLVPMLAYDRAGFRLGYGGGFYDRTLAKLRAIRPIVAIGVAYHDQMVDEVPRGPYDQPLDFVMTEKETFACG